MQISKALLTEDQKLKLPRFLEDEVKDPERTKQVRSIIISETRHLMHVSVYSTIEYVMPSVLSGVRSGIHGFHRTKPFYRHMTAVWQHRHTSLQELSDKIAQLNAAIDDVSSQMKAKDPKPEIIAEELPAQS